jgi:hypothetical protein
MSAQGEREGCNGRGPTTNRSAVDRKPATVRRWTPVVDGADYRNQHFLYVGTLQLLASCKFAGNEGDGYIWYEDTLENELTCYPCSMNLQLEGTETAPSGTSLPISFVKSPPGSYSPILPGTFEPSNGYYDVTVNFGWPAGAHSAQQKSPLGFTLEWTTPYTAGTGTPTIRWAASFTPPV